MISSKLKEFIESNVIGFATVGKNGKPHNIAVAYVKVVEDKIVISNAHVHKSIENLKCNNNVSLVIWDEKWEKSCIGYELIGKAKNYTKGKWFEYVNKLPDNEGYKIISAIVVKVSKVKRLLS